MNQHRYGIILSLHNETSTSTIYYTYLFHLLHARTAVVHVVLELGGARSLKVILKLLQESIIELRQLPKQPRHGGSLQMHEYINMFISECPA